MYPIIQLLHVSDTMSDSCLELTNQQARNLWLERQGLSVPPCGKRQISALADRVSALGMVQLDAIGILARAHHHIMWSRQSAYRQKHYDRLLQAPRQVFEHFSHDAVILPISTYPYWQRQHQRRADHYCRIVWQQQEDEQQLQRQLLEHIGKHGPVCSRDLASHQQGPVDKSVHAWMRPRQKQALDYLWLTGALSVSHRQGFTKYYDLTERVIPEQYRQQKLSTRTQINWLCEQALLKLGFASATDIQRFWDACDLQEVQAWLKKPSKPLIPVSYADTSGNQHHGFALAEQEETLRNTTNATSRLRIINPFDPLVRDRQRLQRLFGFDYRIEIYVPAQRRRYGYYVYPLLEGNRLVGRIDVRANRKADRLETRAWWLEPGFTETAGRRLKIEQELQRLAALAEVSDAGPLPVASVPPAAVQANV